MWRLIVILILALIVAVFAIDNATPVSVHFLVWSLPRMGLALVILISALLGALLGVAVGFSQLFRERRSRRKGMVTVPMAPASGPGEAAAPAQSAASSPAPAAPAAEAAVTHEQPGDDGPAHEPGSGSE